MSGVTIGTGVVADDTARTAAITSGTINGATIGATTPSTGAFTSLTAATPSASDNSTNVATTAWATSKYANVLIPQGSWNASTNTPTLASSTGTGGFFYIVSVAGSTSLNGISSWSIGDWAVFNGTVWVKIDNQTVVASVSVAGIGLSENASTGAITITSNATNANTVSTIVARDSSGNFSAGTISAALSGNASTSTSATTATTATNATNVGITDDTTTNAMMYPTWVAAATGNLPEKVSSTKLMFNPSTGSLTTTTFVGALTGNASTSTTAPSGSNTGDQLIFKTISVSGQSDIVADSTADTLTIVAGSNITLTTNAGTDTLTIAASSSSIGNNQVYVTNSNAAGSTNTKIGRFSTTITNVGTAITYADSATLGGSFTINETGLYSIYLTSGDTTGGNYFGISVNSAQLTTAIQSITDANRLIIAQAPTLSYQAAVSSSVYLTAGDVLRAHYDGSTPSSGLSAMRVIKIGV